MPLVSVIIPAYNAAATIEACVKSAKCQSHKELEIIVVDDGSSDGTAEIAGRMEGVTVLRQSNAGPASARNRGIEESKGEWLAFLDADEEWVDADKIKEQLACAERHRAVIVGVGGRKGAERIIGFRRLLFGNPLVASTVLAKKTSLVEAGCFEKGSYHSEDFRLWLAMTSRGGRAVLAGIPGSRNVAGRLNYAHGGLSGDLAKMQAGEEGNLRTLFRSGCLGRGWASSLAWFVLALSVSRLKYLRRILIRWRRGA